MERIGKLSIEKSILNDLVTVRDEKKQALVVCVPLHKAEAIKEACELHDSLIPPPDLERSGEMVEAHKCELGKWYYDEGWIKADSNGAVGGCEEITVFLSLEQTGVCSTFLSFMDEVELPRKPESEE